MFLCRQQINSGPGALLGADGSDMSKKEQAMKIQRKYLGVLALVASVVVLGGCNKTEEVKPVAAPAAATTPAPAAAPAAPAAAPAAPAAKPTAASAVPAECDAYLVKVNACMSKLGSDNALAGSIKQQVEMTKELWGATDNKAELAEQCKQSTELFAQSATQMGC